jgi:hypothetical protein
MAISTCDLNRCNGEGRAPLPGQDIAAIDDGSDLLSVPT